MSHPDTRWIQRLANFSKPLETVRRAVALASTRPLTELEQQGLIQVFEFTHELAWNVLKDYLEEQGFVGLIGSKNATREAFKNNLLSDGQVWMDMIRARNLSSHTYQTELAAEIAQDVIARFFPAFDEMETRFQALRGTDA